MTGNDTKETRSDLENYLLETSAALLNTLEIGKEVEAAVGILSERLKSGGRIFWCGNGGSAAQAQHMSAELVGRFEIEGKALSSIALTTDTSAITAISNDYGFEKIFSRQLAALGRTGDVIVGYSTSGKSQNLEMAFQEANLRSIDSILFCGIESTKLSKLATLSIHVASKRTSVIQEVHLALGHYICMQLEKLSRTSS
jgi:D-sedoheptulose 7-phosphate isomerase